MSRALDQAFFFIRLHSDTLIAAMLIAVAVALLARAIIRLRWKSKIDKIRRNEERLRNYGT